MNYKGAKKKAKKQAKEKKLHGMVVSHGLAFYAFVTRSFQTSLLAYMQLSNISIVEIIKSNNM